MKEQDRIPLRLFFMASPVPQHLDIASPKVSLRCLLMSDSERNKARVNALRILESLRYSVLSNLDIWRQIRFCPKMKRTQILLWCC